MCGIIAVAGTTKGIEEKTVEAMLSTLSLRGPDARDAVYFTDCILGQTRLSIIDLVGGHQPMKDTARNITIVFNGEIYNHRELRADLERSGHVFRTHSDTEVILKMYIQYGEACTEHLDGMFAFVIWDEDKKELFMARDRFGKKPLYYVYDSDSRLVIASETKALFAAGIKGNIDTQALDNYLTLMYVPPWKSIYTNIHVLPPAHQARYARGKLTLKRYWSLPEHPITPTYDEAKKEIEGLFAKAVEKRMVADVEVGAFLSGGVDSTLVCTYAQKYTKHPLKTFVLGYGDHIDELPFAEQASKAIGTEHRTLQAGNDIVPELEKVMAYLDEPNADSSIYPQHLLSSLTSQHVKVALSGDGADELFMGYGWYSNYWNTSKWVRLKNILISNPFKEHLKYISIFKKEDRRALWKDNRSINDDIVDTTLRDIPEKGVHKINAFDLTTYLTGQLLSKIDRTSMMHSLEVRSPFLDHKLAEYVYNLPLAFKMNGKDHSRKGKIILKDILSEHMPAEFVHRRKQGFGAPVIAWLQNHEVRSAVEKRLATGAHVYEYLKEEEVQKILNSFYAKNDLSQHYKIWSLFCLELWLASHTKFHTHYE